MRHERQRRLAHLVGNDDGLVQHARDHATVQVGLRVLGEAIVIADEMSEPPLPLVSHRVTAGGVEVLATTVA